MNCDEYFLTNLGSGYGPVGVIADWKNYGNYMPYQTKQFIKEAIEEALREHGVIKDEPKATPLDELAGEYAELIEAYTVEDFGASPADDICSIQSFLVAFAEELKEKGII